MVLHNSRTQSVIELVAWRHLYEPVWPPGGHSSLCRNPPQQPLSQHCSEPPSHQDSTTILILPGLQSPLPYSTWSHQCYRWEREDHQEHPLQCEWWGPQCCWWWRWLIPESGRLLDHRTVTVLHTVQRHSPCCPWLTVTTQSKRHTNWTALTVEHIVTTQVLSVWPTWV